MTPYTAPGISLTPELIINRISDFVRVDIKTKCRRREISDNRQIAMFIISRVFPMGPWAIGLLFRKNHATVIYSVHHVSDLIKIDHNYREYFVNVCQAAGLNENEIAKCVK